MASLSFMASVHVLGGYHALPWVAISHQPRESGEGKEEIKCVTGQVMVADANGLLFLLLANNLEP